MRTLLLAVAATLALLAPAVAGASEFKTDKQIRNELVRACDAIVDFASDATDREVVRACNAYWKCDRAFLNLKQVRRMYYGLRAGQDPYPFKAINDRCMGRAIAKARS